jgi:hypothetical protein
MSSYPYPPSEHFPRDKSHEAYRRQYNTRPALVLVRPLNQGLRLAAARTSQR